MTISLLHGDCREVLPTLTRQFHACVTDPPYHLGFMGKAWDGGDVAFQAATWRAVYDRLIPGAYLVAFASTRGYHRMVCAIEDAGFIIHPMLGWLFGSGFPKAADAAKAIDKHLGREGNYVAAGDSVRRIRPGADQNADGTWEKLTDRTYQPHEYQPATPEAAQWEGWKYGLQSLKPALEPICLAQKPMEGNGAENLLKHGVGALNIDASRVETDENPSASRRAGKSPEREAGTWANDRRSAETFSAPRPGEALGRYPANVIHDGSPEVLEAFPDAPGQQADISHTAPSPKTSNVWGKMNREGEPSADRRYTEKGSSNFAALPGQRRDDRGSAARFFYSAKADAADRADSKHPTVKPVDLIRYLVRLVTPPGGHVLDPFAGTGTTAEAAMLERFACTMIERDAQSVRDIEHRIKRWSGLDTPLFA